MEFQDVGFRVQDLALEVTDYGFSFSSFRTAALGLVWGMGSWEVRMSPSYGIRERVALFRVLLGMRR